VHSGPEAVWEIEVIVIGPGGLASSGRVLGAGPSSGRALRALDPLGRSTYFGRGVLPLAPKNRLQRGRNLAATGLRKWRFAGGTVKRMMGLEPTTFCMASRRSSQLSYIRATAEYSPGPDRVYAGKRGSHRDTCSLSAGTATFPSGSRSGGRNRPAARYA
jgi:hypothetical protein